MTNCLPVLTFHALDNRQDVISFPPCLFEAGMKLLHTSGFQTISLLDAAECLKTHVPFPQRSVVLTFDDGYESVYTEAFPVLLRYGMTATIFPTLGTRQLEPPDTRLPDFEGRTMLSWKEIREMQRAGMSIGAHTITHRDLTQLTPDGAAGEIQDGKAVLEEALRVPVHCFAYPFGRYDEITRRIVSKHFACACSDTLGLLHPNSSLFAMERIDAYYLRTERLFGLMVSKWFPGYVRTRGIARRLRRMVPRR